MLVSTRRSALCLQPPDKQEKASLILLEQAEVLSETWATA
jgi:hypothetical protein